MSTPPPQEDNAIAELGFEFFGFHSRWLEHCTGLRMSKPASMNVGMNFETAPQLCLKVFQEVWAWIQSLTCM